MPDIYGEEGDTAKDAAFSISSAGGWVKRHFSPILAVTVLVMAGSLSLYWLTHRPKPQRHIPEPRAVPVEVTAVRSSTERVVVTAMGTVVPARAVELAARVGGEVVYISPKFLPGGHVKKGEVLLRIDPADYELAVRRAQAELDRALAEVEQRTAGIKLAQTEVARAESSLALEMGQQAVARREYELLGKTISAVDKALVLREPQLKAAQAALAAAEAGKESAEVARKAAQASKSSAEVALEQARLDLERTTVRAPFDAVIRSRSAEVGSQVIKNAPLGNLVGTEEYWVEVSVAADQLKWIDVPGFNAEEGSQVRIYYEAAWGPGVFRLGVVKSLLPDLETEGRMARLLISVEDPLDLQKSVSSQRHPLLLGSYIRAEIQGRLLDNVTRIPRSALRSGGNVWILAKDNILEIRPIRIEWSNRDSVFVSDGLAEGDLLITSDLAAPVEGMKLRALDSPAYVPDAGKQALEEKRSGREHGLP